MKRRCAINGFGRIGKVILRILANRNNSNLECVAINIGGGNLDTHLHLLRHDSVHGHFLAVKKINDHTIEIADKLIHVICERDVKQINWPHFKVDTVLECTGSFTTRELAEQHLISGAKKVIVSAPCSGADFTVVYGVNDLLLSEQHRIISVGSCTTNCLAPMAKILHDSYGIESGFMTTIHSYTNDQNILDGNHKDKRRARAANLSMIPSSTGAAKALGLVLPELNGKLDGTAIRVPTPNVSMVDLKVLLQKNASITDINNAFIAAVSQMRGALEVTTEELVSIDFNGNIASCIFDTTQTKVVGDRFVRVVGWYDNEYGFSSRMIDVATLI